MDEKRLKKAFSKVRKDMDSLKKEIIYLKKNNLNSNLENFENKLSEFAEMINEKISLEISSIKLELTNEILNLNSKIDEIKLNKKKSNGDLKIKELDKKVENSLIEFSEMIDEKLRIEMNSLRGEISGEIAKLYDKVFNEIITFKEDIEKLKSDSNKKLKVEKKEISNKSSKVKDNKKTKKEIISNDNDLNLETNEETLYESNSMKRNKGSKESKIKKIAKWLFVDENEEIENIKEEVKNNKYE